MYKFIDNQIRFEDFEQPMGMNIKRDNRWIKKAELIPWAEIEMRYAKLFKNRKGNVAKPLRLALGACIIQAEYGYADEEVVLQIQENPYLQFFCGYKAYDDSTPPFDASLMVHFRRRLTPEILGAINEMIIAAANAEEDSDDDPKPPTPTGDDAKPSASADEDASKNAGTMTIDATCAPSKIKYPQDIELLNKGRMITEKLIDQLHTPAEGVIKPRTYRRNARKDYLAIAKCKRRSGKKLRKAIKKQLSYLQRNLKTITQYLDQGKTLESKTMDQLETVREMVRQQQYMYDNKVHSVENRIVSLDQPWIRPIVRGKAKAKCEFGAKLDISIDAKGYTRLEYYSFDAYNESTNLQEAIKAYKERNGCYPQRVLADKIYRNRENLRFCKEHHITLSGPALGRPRKNECRDKKQDYLDEVERIEVERQISLAKRKCGLAEIVTKREDTTYHCLAMSVVLLNLKKVLRALFAGKLTKWFYSLAFGQMVFVQ